MIDSIKSIYNSIFNKFKNIFVMKKSNILEGMEREIGYINDDIIPLLTKLIQAIDSKTIDVKVIDNDPILKKVRMFLNVDPKTNFNLLNLMLRTCENIVDYSVKLNNMAEKNLSTNITSKTVTVKELGVLKVINNIVLFRNYTMDILYTFLIGMSSDRSIFKPTLERLNNNARIYGEAIDAMSSKKLDTILKSIVNMPSSQALSVMSAEGTVAEGELKNIQGMNLVPSIIGNGFIGNPIYHLRILIEDAKFNRNEIYKDQIKAIELILIELRKKQSNEFDKALEKQIQYYENKITGLEYKIAKYESS